MANVIDDNDGRTTLLANAGNFIFSGDFEALEESDVVVWVQPSGAPQAEVVSPTEYTVSIDSTTKRPTVTFAEGRAAGDVITIARNTSVVLQSALAAVKEGRAQSVDDALIRMTLVLQDFQRQLQRAFRLSDAEEDFDPAAPGVAGAVMALDANLRPFWAAGAMPTDVPVSPYFASLLSAANAAAVASALGLFPVETDDVADGAITADKISSDPQVFTFPGSTTTFGNQTLRNEAAESGDFLLNIVAQGVDDGGAPVNFGRLRWQILSSLEGAHAGLWQLKAAGPANSDQTYIDVNGSTDRVSFPRGAVGLVAQRPNSIVKTDPETFSSGSWVDIPGMEISITPKNANNKITVSFSLSLGGSTSSYAGIRLLKNGAIVAQGDAIGSATRCTTAAHVTDQNRPENASFEITETAGTTSEITYKLQLIDLFGTIYLNRSLVTSESFNFSGSSTLSVEELWA